MTEKLTELDVERLCEQVRIKKAEVTTKINTGSQGPRLGEELDKTIKRFAEEHRLQLNDDDIRSLSNFFNGLDNYYFAEYTRSKNREQAICESITKVKHDEEKNKFKIYK